MSAQKLMYYLAVITIVVAVTQVDSYTDQKYYANNNTNKSHNLILGYRMPGDRLVLKDSVIKNSSWMRVVVVERTFNTTRFDRITQVLALDQKTNGNGADVTVLNGGPGRSNVTLRFKSQRNHGINFIVELYARP